MMQAKADTLIAAPPDRVWRALTADLGRWWTAPYFVDPDHVTGLVLEPGVGGRFMECWGEPGQGYLLGQVVEWLPPLRLGFTWQQPNWAGAVTLVAVRLEPEGEGTRVLVSHEGFERVPGGGEKWAGYAHGWSDLLGKLRDFTVPAQGGAR
jgi:uncharacterized protein YndB with AHSA1/START domain